MEEEKKHHEHEHHEHHEEHKAHEHKEQEAHEHRSEHKEHEHHEHKENESHSEHKEHEHHPEHTHHEAHEHKKSASEKKWQILSVSLAILLVISIGAIFAVVISGGYFEAAASGEAISADEAAESAVAFINANLLQEGITANLTGVAEKSEVYNVNFTIEDRDYSTYVTKDGRLLFIDSIDTVEFAAQQEGQEQQETQEPSGTKSDKPEVELFVMSYCPYGTQAEKGIIPAVNALGDKIDFNLRFVYYAMHGEKEITEQTREYCIQEEQPDKFMAYLTCFLEGSGEASSSGYITEGNDPDYCIEQAGIDAEQLESCIESADETFAITANLEDTSSWLSGRYPLFNVDAAKNQAYGVSGSPTLVINGAKASGGRDSASYLKAICDSFNEAPEECETELSSSTPTPYFGWGGTGANTAAECG